MVVPKQKNLCPVKQGKDHIFFAIPPITTYSPLRGKYEFLLTVETRLHLLTNSSSNFIKVHLLLFVFNPATPK